MTTPDARPVSEDECVRFCEIALTLDYSDKMKRHFSAILQRLRELQSLRAEVERLTVQIALMAEANANNAEASLARIASLEARNAELCLDVAGHNFVRNERDRLLAVIESAHDALTYPWAEHHEQITVALGILGNAMAARRAAMEPATGSMKEGG